jgi:hypothetical protein
MPHHAHSIDRWDDATGSNLYEHLAGVNDLLLARATFAAAIKRWPGAKITLSNGARIIEKTWPADDRACRQPRSGMTAALPRAPIRVAMWADTRAKASLRPSQASSLL